MPVEFYITRDPVTSRERQFEYPFEREAILLIAKELREVFHGKSELYALVANLESPAVDMVVITPDGIGLADLKHSQGAMRGEESTRWSYVESGDPVMAGSYINPYQQVESYREQIRGKLANAGSDLPEWFGWRDFLLQSTLVFTGKNVDTSAIHLPHRVSAWFTMRGLHQMVEWVASLSFGQGHQIGPSYLRWIATNLLKGTPWKEVETLLDAPSPPYGRLWRIQDGRRAESYDLTRDATTIGRAAEICLPPNMTHVSRSHATLRRTPHGVLLRDDHSTWGTWTRPGGKDAWTPDTRLKPGEERFLTPGDQILLGSLDDQKRPSEISFVLEFESVETVAVPATFTIDSRELEALRANGVTGEIPRASVEAPPAAPPPKTPRKTKPKAKARPGGKTRRK